MYKKSRNNVWFQKISIPTPSMIIGNSKGVCVCVCVCGDGGRVGVSKAKIFKGKYEAKLEFPEGWGGGGVQPKNLPWGRFGNFLEQHIAKMLCLPGIEYSALSLSYPRNVTISG